jgi:iron(III) transport system substrate-binding protein
VPKSYDDLLQPRWKGQLGWDTEEYYLFGALMKARGKEKGLDYWRRLAAQQINFRKGYTLISELVSAGEFPVAVSLYQHRSTNTPRKARRCSGSRPTRWSAATQQNFAVEKRAAAQRRQIVHRLHAVGEGQKLLQDKGEVRAGSASGRKILG